MSQENQHIEFKESWRDEYLRWIAAFANSQGGYLYIGKNDKGDVVGVANAKKLLEDIPNKVRDILGILVEVNLMEEDGKPFLEILVDAYPFPVSYKGEFHIRSGSTKQELKGAALHKFILQRTGKHWDGMALPGLQVTALDENAFAYFRDKAKRSKRLSEDVLQEDRLILLDRLHLLEGQQLKRAVALLFYADPEKYVTGAYVKIGFFESDTDLRYQDEIHGNLFDQVEKTLQLLLTKYMSAAIRYEGINRVEEYPYPEEALREALTNAVAHKNYVGGAPIQISVYTDKLMIWNEGELPEGWSIEKLTGKHPSKPANPDIANTFFRAGMIESWGRGIIKIFQSFDSRKLPPPEFKTDFGGLMVEFRASDKKQKASGKASGKMSGKTSGKGPDRILKILRKNPEITIPELASIVNITPRSIERNLEKLRKSGKIKRIGSHREGYWKILE